MSYEYGLARDTLRLVPRAAGTASEKDLVTAGCRLTAATRYEASSECDRLSTTCTTYCLRPGSVGRRASRSSWAVAPAESAKGTSGETRNSAGDEVKACTRPCDAFGCEGSSSVALDVCPTSACMSILRSEWTVTSQISRKSCKYGSAYTKTRKQPTAGDAPHRYLSETSRGAAASGLWCTPHTTSGSEQRTHIDCGARPATGNGGGGGHVPVSGAGSSSPTSCGCDDGSSRAEACQREGWTRMVVLRKSRSGCWKRNDWSSTYG
mmetsp:Transcript_5246/g.17315  ORF Transcript_5246/g.17315 Transcript_5246/m.17315 type:complete len:265 (-) Transcript_5246:1127-1921(-)